MKFVGCYRRTDEGCSLVTDDTALRSLALFPFLPLVWVSWVHISGTQLVIFLHVGLVCRASWSTVSPCKISTLHHLSFTLLPMCLYTYTCARVCVRESVLLCIRACVCVREIEWECVTVCECVSVCIRPPFRARVLVLAHIFKWRIVFLFFLSISHPFSPYFSSPSLPPHPTHTHICLSFCCLSYSLSCLPLSSPLSLSSSRASLSFLPSLHLVSPIFSQQDTIIHNRQRRENPFYIWWIIRNSEYIIFVLSYRLCPAAVTCTPAVHPRYIHDIRSLSIHWDGGHAFSSRCVLLKLQFELTSCSGNIATSVSCVARNHRRLVG